MPTNPFHGTEEQIAPGGLAARLVRNADPRTDPNGGNLQRLPVAPASDHAPGNQPALEPAEANGGSDEWLGRWAVLAMFGLTAALAGVFLVLWFAGGPGTSPPEPPEAAAALPMPAVPLAPALPMMTDEVTAPSPVTPAPAAPAPERPIETTGLTPSADDIRALQSRGDALLNAGEIAAARPLLERAALAGDATAALRLGQSYDPGYLAGAGLRPAAGNLGLAIFWYRRSQELGNGTAAFLARKLETAARAEWGPISTRPPAWRP